jgi:GTP-binding protein HflX
MTKIFYYQTTQHPETLIIGVQAPYNRTNNIDSYFQEFKNLVKTRGIQYQHEMFIKLRSVDTGYFFTSGKLQEIKDYITKHNIKEVILSESLSPQHERNLTDFLEVGITDRTLLILEIFEQAAHSAEGKAQVEIALLQHRKSRLAGKGYFMAQQEGRTGVRGGPGETAKEVEKRHIDNVIHRLEREILQLEKTRETQRKRRLENKIPQICLIGYTNAGKSTILNALTKSNVLAEDKLFATLDTTTRELYINGKKKGVLSDTVGFIQQLPPKLIKAFKSTLAELKYADLLVQVVDVSDSNWIEHLQVVHEILDELEVHQDMLYVFNKADQVKDLEALKPQLDRFQPHVITTATSKEGLQELIAFLNTWEKKDSV